MSDKDERLEAKRIIVFRVTITVVAACVYIFELFISQNESADFLRVRLILLASRENRGALMDLSFYLFFFCFII